MEDFFTLTNATCLFSALLIGWCCIPKRHKAPNNTIGTAPSPPFVPYYIPVIGSAFSLLRYGILPFLRQERQNIKGDETPIVTVLVGGKRMNFIVDPEAFDSAFRYSTKYLSMGPVISDFAMSFFGFGRDGLETTIRSHDGLRPLLDHLLKSEGLTKVTTTVQLSMDRHLQTIVSEKQSISMDLMTFARAVLFRSTLDSVISPTVSHSEFLPAYEIFERAMLPAFANLPIQYVAPKSFHARKQLLQWFSDPKNEWSDYLKARREYLANLGVSLDDQARDMLFWTWGAVVNYVPSVFWFIYHVGTIPEALEAIRAEVDPLLKRKDVLALEDLEQMPALTSVFYEVLRYTLRFLISRQVMQDMELDLRCSGRKSKYFVKEGDQVILFTPVLQEDAKRFPNPNTFQWDRFLTPESRKQMSPFGGGPHYCPGRKFAENGAKAFIARLVHRYDICIEGETKRDMGRDGLGITHPTKPVKITLNDRKI